MPSPIDDILDIMDNLDRSTDPRWSYKDHQKIWQPIAEAKAEEVHKQPIATPTASVPIEEKPEPPAQVQKPQSFGIGEVQAQNKFMKNLVKNVHKPIKPSQAKFSSTKVNSVIQELLKKKNDKILAIGVGGAGSNAVSRLAKKGIQGAITVAANTDAYHLLNVEADLKLILGADLTEGLGAGSDPIIGKAAAEESEEDIRELVRDADLVFVQAGLGGGTGTGAAPVIAEIARSEGALVVGVCTLPFEMEGEERVTNAIDGLKELYSTCDTVIVIPNQKLLLIDQTLPLDTAFKVADEILIRAVQGIVNLVRTAAYVNVDFADIRQVLKAGGSSVIGVGEGEGPTRVEDALRESLAYSLLDIQIMDAKAALIHIAGGDTLSLEEIQRCVKTVTNELGRGAKVIWGSHIDPSLGPKVELTIILSGVESPYTSEMPEKTIPEDYTEDISLQSPQIKTIWDI